MLTFERERERGIRAKERNLHNRVAPPSPPKRSTRRQIRVFSFETGFEVVLQGGKRLSTNTHGDGDAVRGGKATPAAIAAAATAPIVAAEVSSDNGTLAVACAGSGASSGGYYICAMKEDGWGFQGRQQEPN